MCSAVIVIVFAVLAARVAQLQLFSGDKYKALATEQSLHKVPLAAQRGSVFDRNGRDLAMSIERTTVYADPTLVDDPAGHAAKLAPILGVDPQELLPLLSDHGTPEEPRRFVYLARTVDDDVAAAVRDLRLPGIGFTPESDRSYPAGAIAGSVIGHVGTDGNGLDGIEYLYDTRLAGKPGELVVERDPLGHDIPDTRRTHVEARRGTDLVLTLDESMQYEVEYSLLDQVRATNANSGMAAVVDITNGDVLSLASVVGATADEPARVAQPGDRNAPLTDLFEPGSTTKLVTISWALEHGFVAPDTPFEVPNWIRVHPDVEPYWDAEPHYGAPNGVERWTTTEILQHSSNVGTIKIAQRMRNQDIADALRTFGLGTKTALEWPGQPRGILLSPSKYFATGKYSSAIGYGVAVTGMQMLDAFVTIANGGVTRSPHLLAATIDARGDRTPVEMPEGRRVVSANTAAVMTDMLAGVVAGGTGACAAVPGYRVAGKTGTTKKQLANGGYAESATMASFIGFAPAENPRFAAIVVLDAKDLRYGGAVAAPVFSEIMRFALTQYGVPPSDAGSAQYADARETAAGTDHVCTVPHGPDLDGIVAEREQATTDSLPDDPSQQT